MNHSNLKILIFGSSGLLGSALINELKNIGYKLFLPQREVLNSENSVELIMDLILKEGITKIINLIANTNVDNCEEFPLKAYQSNVQILEKFIDVFAKTGIHLIHLSTDQVYFGKGPHFEDNPNPCNVYALTKYLSEYVASKVNSTILRTNFTGKSLLKNRTSFSDWIVDSIKNKKEIKLFNDIYFSPLSIKDLCKYIEIVIESKNRGLYNLGSRDSISKAEFGCELIRNLGLNLDLVTIINSNCSKRKALRPNDMSMSVKKFEEKFELTLPTICETNKLIFQDYLNDH